MRLLYIFAFALIMTACGGSQETSEDTSENTENKKEEADGYSGATVKDQIHYEQETHLANVRQLTFGGDNAEAYWSFDDTKLTFQSNYSEWGLECDQIFYFDVENDDLSKAKPQLISTGLGRTTCSYFMPGDSTIVYSSTHAAADACPPVPERRADGKYIWPIYAGYDIYVADLEGNIINQLTKGEGYNAEPTVSPLGDKIVFTSLRSGDLELYVMDIDGSNVVQITDELGYDGGAFFSPDGSKIIFRSSRPQTEEEIADYKGLLADGLVEPTDMEIYVCNADGSDLRKVTDLGGANWAPFFHPSGDKILFSSNHHVEGGRAFNLFMINLDGTGLTQITFDGVFDAFPMFSRDGKKVVFSSNRNNGGSHDTNLFVADWVE